LVRVVPIMSASVAWLTLAMTGCGLPSLPKFAGLRPLPSSSNFTSENQQYRELRQSRENAFAFNSDP